MVRTYDTTGKHSRRMLKKARLLTRPTPARRDAPFRGKAAASEGPRRTLWRMLRVLNDARTKLANFFSILQVESHIVERGKKKWKLNS